MTATRRCRPGGRGWQACLLAILLLAAAPAETQEKAAAHFLWRMEAKGSVVHFLGSFHLAVQEVYPLAAPIYQAFEQSETLVAEVNIFNMDPATFQELMAGKASYPEGDSLDRHLPPDLLKRIEEFLAPHGLSLEEALKLKPWFMATLISALEAQGSGFDPKWGMDLHFLTRAREAGKRIIGLETAEEQLDFFAAIPPETQARFLELTLRDIELIGSTLEEMLEYWKQGQVEPFAELLLQSYRESPQLLPVYELLFVQRNRNWLEKIEALLEQEGNYFVVVGAGHLVGEHSLIQLLREKEYSLQQR